MSKTRYYIDYNKAAFACSIEWRCEEHRINTLKPFIDYIRCDLDGEDYVFLRSRDNDFDELEIVNFETIKGIGENTYTLCYVAWIKLNLDVHPKFKRALSFSSNKIEAVIGFRCGEEIIEDCYDPIDDYAVPLIIDRPIRF
jgi:hypothetical protein